MLQNVTHVLEGNPALARRNRFARLVVAVQAGARSWTVRFGADPIVVEPGLTAAPDLELRGPAEAWATYAKPMPDVGFQNLTSMMRLGHIEVRGAMLEFGRNLMLLEEVFASMRGRPEGTRPSPAPVGKPWIEPVTGRYLHTDLNGRPHRIYFEEAGPTDGIPLLCLHTAGADGRQYRAILNDSAITQAYRVISFDLPWHGKSSPPPGFETEVYRLTTKLYIDTIMTVIRALRLNRPVVMGCSIGGRAVLHLALSHGAEFRAAIGLQSALYAQPDANPVLRELEVIHRPDVHGGDASAAFVACLMAPASSTPDRWETLWHYAQGGPGIFMGDLVYYMADGDMRNLDLSPLEKQECPIYLLTGEYDISATPALTADLAKKVNARHFEVMPGLGHFPMSEAPERFLGYLRPVLEQIRALD